MMCRTDERRAEVKTGRQFPQCRQAAVVAWPRTAATEEVRTRRALEISQRGSWQDLPMTQGIRKV